MTTLDVLRAIENLENSETFPTQEMVAAQLRASRPDVHALMVEARVRGLLVHRYQRTAKFGGRDAYYLTFSGRAFLRAAEAQV